MLIVAGVGALMAMIAVGLLQGTYLMCTVRHPLTAVNGVGY